MIINSVEVTPDFILRLKEGTSEADWNKFWDSVSAQLKERIVATEDTQLVALKNKISHVEELRGLFREMFSVKK